jgi:WD40 repeat protein
MIKNIIKYYAKKAGKHLKEPYVTMNHNHNVREVCYSQDSKLIISGGEDGLVHIFDLIDQKLVWTCVHNSCISRLTITSDNKFVIVACYDGKIYVWDIIKKTLLWKRGNREAILELILIDDNRIVSYSQNNIMTCWDIKSGKRKWSKSKFKIEGDEDFKYEIDEDEDFDYEVISNFEKSEDNKYLYCINYVDQFRLSSFEILKISVENGRVEKSYFFQYFTSNRLHFNKAPFEECFIIQRLSHEYDAIYSSYFIDLDKEYYIWERKDLLPIVNCKIIDNRIIILSEKSLGVYDLRTGKKIFTETYYGELRNLCLNSKRGLLAFSNIKTEEVLIFDLNNYHLIDCVACKNNYNVLSICPNGYFISSSSGSKLLIWSLSNNSIG